jgi:hypothetical protein
MLQLRLLPGTEFSKKAISRRRCIWLSVSVALHCIFVYLLIFFANTESSKRLEVASPPPPRYSVLNVDFISLHEAHARSLQVEALSSIVHDVVASSLELNLESQKSALLKTREQQSAYYFKERELSTKTKGSLDIPPELTLKLAAESPRVAKIRLLVDEFGEVDFVIVDESNFTLDEQKILIDFYKHKKFDAGKIDDLDVKSEISLDITIAK